MICGGTGCGTYSAATRIGTSIHTCSKILKALLFEMGTLIIWIPCGLTFLLSDHMCWQWTLHHLWLIFICAEEGSSRMNGGVSRYAILKEFDAEPINTLQCS